MRRLSVEKFSCIDSAELDLARFTILVGPQASGKSVLCKLVYFFYKIISDQTQYIEDGDSFAVFQRSVRQRFIEWFPISAWGNRKFVIVFEHDLYQVRLTRFVKQGHVSKTFRMAFSKELSSAYRKSLLALKELQTGEERHIKSAADKETLDLVDRYITTRDVVRRTLRTNLSPDLFAPQLFIPAGRSFFTSVGKAISALKIGIDPVTHAFGEYLVAVRERGARSMPTPFFRRINPRFRLLIEQSMRELFGGQIHIEKNQEFVETKDGRRIPFSALSSGQQELLPLWLVIQQRLSYPGQLYIEEPEAHLFPSAQSAITQLLVTMIKTNSARSGLVVTTHSPYVLSTFNNLLFAYSVSKHVGEDGARELAEVIPKSAWLDPSTTRAYAIKGRTLVSIIDNDGLIDSSYIDEVSGDIARKFDQILKVEEKYVSH